jgi:diguanylate cyclase (GGDEF)-like protein
MTSPSPAPAPTGSLPLAEAARQAWGTAAPLWPGLLAGRGQALAVKDAASGCYLAIGPGWQALFGLDPADCVGRTDMEIFGGAVAAPWRAADQMALDRPDAVASEHAFEWRGQWRELSVTRQGAEPQGNGTRQILSHWTDVRAQREQARLLAEALAALQQAREQVDAARRGQAPADDLRDPVSGLPGRAPFVQQLRREFDLSAREGREMSLVLLEVDPPAAPPSEGAGLSGDDLAREVGSWLRSGTRAMDATGRLGATRYAILLSGAGLPIAARRAEALRGARQLPGPEPATLTLSIGVASYPLSADSPDGLMQAAEQALSRARGRGGNQVALAGLSLQELPGG